MSAGNLKNDRSKGNNFRSQFDTLRLLGSIAAAAAGGATEETLQLLYAAIQSKTDYEAKLVQDSDTLPVTWLEVRIWDAVLQTWGPTTYYPAGSSVAGDPVMPVVYLNPTTILSLIEANTAIMSTPVTGLTASNFRVVGAGVGTVAAGKRRVSIFNAGATDATAAGATLKAGEITTFVAGERDVLAAIAYDALTSELLISTVG